jgi:hypothetical protein
MAVEATTVVVLRDVARIPGGVGGLDDVARAGLPLPAGLVVPVPVLRQFDGRLPDLGSMVGERALAELGPGRLLVRTTEQSPSQAAAVDAEHVGASVVHLATVHPTEAILVHGIDRPAASGTVQLGGRDIEVHARRGLPSDGQADRYVVDEHGTWVREITIAEKSHRLDRRTDGTLVEHHLTPFESHHGVLDEDEALVLANFGRSFHDLRRTPGWLEWEVDGRQITFTGWHPRHRAGWRPGGGPDY